jgi:hypothetical protein
VLEFDKKKAKWKDDGFSYERRANDVGFKEHSERIGDDKKLVCLYSSIAREDPIYDEHNFKSSSDAEIKFQRRIYKHLELYPNLIIVHYFASKKLKKAAEEKRSATSTEVRYSEEDPSEPFSLSTDLNASLCGRDFIPLELKQSFRDGCEGGSDHRRSSCEADGGGFLSFSSGLEMEEEGLSATRKILDLERQVAALKKQLHEERSTKSNTSTFCDQEKTSKSKQKDSKQQVPSYDSG